MRRQCKFDQEKKYICRSVQAAKQPLRHRHDYEPSRVPTHRSPSKKAKGLLAALLMSVSYLAGWFTRATVDVRLQGIQAIRPAVAFAGIPPGKLLASLRKDPRL